MASARSIVPEPPDDLFAGHLRILHARTEAALIAAGFDGLIVPAGQPVSLPFDDQDYPFRANPYFRWWVPRADPGACVVFEPTRKPLLLLPHQHDFWHVPPAPPSDAWSGEFELRLTESPCEVARYLRSGPRWAVLGDPASGQVLGKCNPPALLHHLEFERAIKTPYEIACVRKANKLGAGAHLAAERAFRSGASEFDIHMAYCAALRHREQELPYNNIIALDAHGAVLHYQSLDRATRPDAGTMLIDAGASERGYAADISRTHVRRPGEMADLVAAMDSLQRSLCEMVHPGRDYVEIHLQAHLRIGDLLHEAGLTHVDGEAAVATGLSSVFFPHGVGHLLGLQVHDVGGLLVDHRGSVRARPPGHPYLRLTRMIEPGFVVTIEPGIYFIDSLLRQAANSALKASIAWDRVDTLRCHGGIRIEDDVVATTTEPENLTRRAFAELEALE